MRIDLNAKTSRNLQTMPIHEFALTQDFTRRAVGDDSTRVQNDHARRHVDGEFQVVGGDDLGPASETRSSIHSRRPRGSR